MLHTIKQLGMAAGLLLLSTMTYAQDDAAAACQSALETQESEFNDINARNPDPNDTIPSLQVVLYMTSERMKLLDDNCSGQPQYGMYDSLKASYDSAMSACTAIATSSSVCVAQVPW